MHFKSKEANTWMFDGKYGGFRKRKNWGEEEGEEDQSAPYRSYLCGLIDLWDTVIYSMKPKVVVHREIRLSNGTSCFPHNCVQKIYSLWKLWYTVLIDIPTSALFSLSGVLKPSTLPLLHQTQPRPMAHHRTFVPGEAKFLLLLVSAFTVELTTLHSLLFMLFSASRGERKSCVGCVILSSFQKFAFEIA